MRTRCWQFVRWSLALSGAWGAFEPHGRTEPPPALDVDLYAGLTVTGSVGRVYAIEHVADGGLTNGATGWRCAEYLELPASPFLWTDKSLPATGIRFYRAVLFEPPTNMVFIPPGTYRMGSPTNDVDRIEWEGPQTAVTITRGFWMGKCELTQAEYLAVVGTNPSALVDPHRPVERVSWFDATNYCAIRTEQERAAGRIASNCVYRLPTEAEWEYACRAWTSTRFTHGDDPDYAALSDHAWYLGNSFQVTHPVGEKLPNPWGLHDMPGNVWEWCQDWWSGELPGGTALDPVGPPTGTFRVIRGGFHFSLPGHCRSAYRMMGPFPTSRSAEIGFRVVLATGPL